MRRHESFAERRDRRAAVDDIATVLDAAARFLEARPRSTAEVRRRLASAGYRPELVAQAIERLVELGYVDDEAFARTWVESRDRAHPRGERALRNELREKGVAREIVDEVLGERAVTAGIEPGGAFRDEKAASDTVPDADERAALALLTRRRSTLDRLADPRVRRQRAYALLARNGFDPDTASRVSAAFLRSEPRADDS